MNQLSIITIGIDPGSSSGGISIIKDNILETYQMKDKTEQEIENIIHSVWEVKDITTRMIAIIERVAAYPGQGVTSMFKFGMNYGFLRGCLTANRISFQDVTPQSWMKYYSVSKKKEESKTIWKRRLLQIAQNLYPENKIPLNCGDSVLLANYGKYLLKNG